MLQQHLPHVRHAKLGLAGPHEGEHDRGRRDGTGDVAQSHRALLTEEGKGDMPLLCWCLYHLPSLFHHLCHLYYHPLIHHL